VPDRPTPCETLMDLADVLAAFCGGDPAIASALVAVDGDVDVPSRPAFDGIHGDGVRVATIADVCRCVVGLRDVVGDLERRRQASAGVKPNGDVRRAGEPDPALAKIPFGDAVEQLVRAHGWYSVGDGRWTREDEEDGADYAFDEVVAELLRASRSAR
jgi:hypothetical protein